MIFPLILVVPKTQRLNLKALNSAKELYLRDVETKSNSGHHFGQRYMHYLMGFTDFMKMFMPLFSPGSGVIQFNWSEGQAMQVGTCNSGHHDDINGEAEDEEDGLQNN